jgi:hypothetical protein
MRHPVTTIPLRHTEITAVSLTDTCMDIAMESVLRILKLLRHKMGHILSVTDSHYALIITPLFDTQTPTCFGIHVTSSGRFLCPYELTEAP